MRILFHLVLSSNIESNVKPKRVDDEKGNFRLSFPSLKLFRILSPELLPTSFSMKRPLLFQEPLCMNFFITDKWTSVAVA